ncbi:MAG TPA: hypothetical protein ENK02_07295 [Planctomycetes bacterium]|nr:hypothetical protein [Planctomycetota bacterium]
MKSSSRGAFLGFTLLGSLLTIGLGRALPNNLFASPQGTKLTETQKGEEIAAIVTFSSLGIRSIGSKDFTKIPAEYLREIRLLEAKDDRNPWMELFFVDGDYVLRQFSGITFYQDNKGVGLSKVRVVRTSRRSMRFPFVN